MDYFISFTRYILPVLALIILSKCVMTLLLGHPVNKTYGYIIDRTDGEKIPLNTWETSIGRSNSCDITVGYDTVSRFQAVISRRPDGWYIYDTMSRSGIKVNGEKIDRRAVIKHGDSLTFGDRLFAFAVADDPVIQVGKKRGRDAKRAAAAPLPANAQAAADAVRPRYVEVKPPAIKPEPLDEGKFEIDTGKKAQPEPEAKPTLYSDKLHSGQVIYSEMAETSPAVFSGSQSAEPPAKSKAIKKEPAVVNSDTGEIYVLCGSAVIVGRGRGCDINLPDMTVSRRHAVLRKYEDGWGVEDAGSKHGTLLNGKPISVPQLLYDGDIIGVSEYRFIFRLDHLDHRKR